jgi:hypothetical protein
MGVPIWTAGSPGATSSPVRRRGLHRDADGALVGPDGRDDDVGGRRQHRSRGHLHGQAGTDGRRRAGTGDALPDHGQFHRRLDARPGDVLAAGGISVEGRLVEGRQGALADDLLGAEQALRVEDGEFDRVRLRHRGQDLVQVPLDGTDLREPLRQLRKHHRSRQLGLRPRGRYRLGRRFPGFRGPYRRARVGRRRRRHDPRAAHRQRAGRPGSRHRRVDLRGVPVPPVLTAVPALARTAHPHHRRFAVPSAARRQMARRPMVPLSRPVRATTRPRAPGR